MVCETESHSGNGLHDGLSSARGEAKARVFSTHALELDQGKGYVYRYNYETSQFGLIILLLCALLGWDNE